MTANRRSALAAGLLFIVATGAAGVAAAIEPSRATSLDLAQVAANLDRYGVASLFLLIAAGTSVGIAIALYPILRPVGRATALGSVVFRAVEAVFYVIAVVSLWTTMRLATGTTTDQATNTALAALVVSLRDHAALAGVFAFCTGALLYYALFLQSRLIPRWLSGWGIVGAVCMLTACVLAVFADRPITGYTPLIAPIAVQEMVFGVWLLAKGVSQPTTRVVEQGAPTAVLNESPAGA